MDRLQWKKILIIYFTKRRRRNIRLARDRPGTVNNGMADYSIMTAMPQVIQPIANHMVDAGISAPREIPFTTDWADVVKEIYMAMEYKRRSHLHQATSLSDECIEVGEGETCNCDG